MLTLKNQRRGETYIYRDGKYIGAWLGEVGDIKRLAELSNEDEERRFAREGIPVCDNPDQAQLPLTGTSEELRAEAIEQHNEDENADNY